MPTISQLPAASQVTAADQIPISQGGVACSVSVGTLLAGTQPAILAATGSLLGRTSLGAGGPDPVGIGIGLFLNADTLVADGADHAGFPAQGTLIPSDEVVLSSEGNPKLLQLSLLRGLFSPGSNISIDQYGTISTTLTGGSMAGTSEYSITDLSTVATISPGDLVAISQAGSDHTITYANLIDGLTIDEAQAAAVATGADTFLVAQGSNVMLRQTLSAVWTWLSSQLPTYLLPTLELTANTTLSAAVHNGRVLVCSQPITITPGSILVGSGFSCDLINLSAGNVTLASGITTSSGSPSLPPGQAASLVCATYSGGTLLYAWISVPPPSSGVPGQVSGLTASTESTSSVLLAWAEPSPSPTSYAVQYRVSGTEAWVTAPSVTTLGCTITGLLSATSYDFVVSAANGSGVGLASAIVSATTTLSLSVPGQVTGLVASDATASSMSLVWSPPQEGGTASSYTALYRVTGTASWSTAISGLVSSSFVVTGLVASTSYDFEVLGVNTSGTGLASSVTTASTTSGDSVSSITWNVPPAGTFVHGTGAIGVNAHVSPSSAPVQFGFSTSLTLPPTSWTSGSYVNTDLWGAYVDTPSVPGTWFAWAEGIDGSSQTVYPTGFSVT